MTGYFPPEPHQTQGSLEQARILDAQNRGAGGSWMGFAGTFLILIGLLNLVWAVVALSKPEQFDETSLLWENLRGTAWLLIPAGLLQILAGVFVLARKTFGRIVALIVAGLGLLINFVTIDAHPLWSLIILVANALVIWAVTVHAHDEDHRLSPDTEGRVQPMPLATTFWDVFFLLLIFLPLVMVWAFALVDIFRREDMSGPWKAIWVLCVICVPFLGTIVYLVFRRPAALSEPTEAPGDSKYMLRTLDDLHRRGKLTDEEYAAEKARVLAG